MDKKTILNALQRTRENAAKRKFVQSFDLIFNLRQLDLKKETDKVNAFIAVPYALGKKITTTALVGPELSIKAKEACSHVVLSEEFKTIDKKKVKKLARETDFFIAQATVMPQVAAAFGKVLGPRGKMPNLKAGCVVPPTADLKPLIEKLQKTVHVETKNEPTLKLRIGAESLKDEEVAENIFAVYNTVLHALPQEKQNIKNVMLKLTMGKPVVIAEEEKK